MLLGLGGCTPGSNDGAKVTPKMSDDGGCQPPDCHINSGPNDDPKNKPKPKPKPEPEPEPKPKPEPEPEPKRVNTGPVPPKPEP